jgi:competence protein ComEC
MTGAYATSVRAGIMAILVLIAKVTGRPYDVLRAVILTIILMLFYNPYLLYFDISFELSFVATIAVIFLNPKIAKYFYFIPKVLNLRDLITVTFSAYIFVLPFVLYKMGNLSLVALPTNFLVLPFIPLTMLLRKKARKKYRNITNTDYKKALK